MSPKEKAKELVERFMDFPLQKLTDYSQVYYPTAKYFALVCVDEIMKQFVGLEKPEYTAFDAIGNRQFTFEQSEYETHMTGYDMQSYWHEVKQEIEKL